MENKEILELITKLNKKVDKLTNIVTKMGKALHLIAVSEKEERELQLLQRSNLAVSAKVSEEIAAMAPKNETQTPEMLTIFDNLEHAGLF